MVCRERSIQSNVDNRWFKGACGQSRGGGQGGIAGFGWVSRRAAGALRCAGFTRVAGTTVLSTGRGTPMWAAAFFRRHSYKLTSEVVIKKKTVRQVKTGGDGLDLRKVNDLRMRILS